VYAEPVHFATTGLPNPLTLAGRSMSRRCWWSGGAERGALVWCSRCLVPTLVCRPAGRQRQFEKPAAI